MAEVFLGAFVNVLVEKFASGDLWNFARKERIDTLLRKWSSMLEQVQAVVADAEEKQITDRETNLWLSDLEELSYDMDDVLDEFATEALRRKVMKEPRASTSKFLAREICFRPEDKPLGSESINKARHSSFRRGYRDGIKKFEAFQKAKNLRTFLTCGSRHQGFSYLTSNVPLRLLPGLRCLRVLSLRSYGIRELSNSIGVLKLVRYLDLSCALILTLPESISTLYNLQTLILRDCKNLKKLPANTSDLICLRHLDVTGADSLQEMPPKIGKLTSLQTLSNFIVGNGNGSTITELGNLIHLRGTLCISGLENVTDALGVRGANLKDKQGLDVLLMKWSNISDNSRNGSVESKVLDMLEPHEKLKELSINGYGGLTFPTWVKNSLFSNMVCLKFQNCEKCTSLPSLGQLPSLAKLYIQGMKAIDNVGLEFYGLGYSNPFPALEILTFEDMPEWKDWTPFGGGGQAFALLSKLSIKRCPKLLHVSPRYFPRLRKLDIEECPVLVVAWGSNPILLNDINEVRNTVPFDSFVSLNLKNVPIPDSFYIPKFGDQVVLQNTRHSFLSSLTFLKVENIRDRKCLPSWFFQGLTGLQELYLFGFEELTTLWKNEVRIQGCLPALRRLTIERCPKLSSLFAEGEEGDELISLQELSIYRRLKTLPDVMQNNGLRKLSQLVIRSCDNLKSLPEGWFPTTNLTEFDIIRCTKLEPLPNHAYNNNNLASLEKLGLYSSPAATGLVSHILDERNSSYFTNLSSLTIANVDIPSGGGKLCGLHSLRKLNLYDCDWVSFPKDVLPSSLVVLDIWIFPELKKLSFKDFENLVSLEQLCIKNCRKLKSISELGPLPSLSDLLISDCPKLASFPEQGLPPSLLYLQINGCPKLKQRCEKGKGQYWRFIADVPQVMIDED
ncbi:hypothetical protein RHGRI_000487 [Rhododendron griersonianum]|uniref:Rx N-terminal domain-containing protein n=1 Tax=Rhododendron griersonianum TaxID=479676 RepID=A0AAV6LHP1_9ERIC|nr:hypothetical protein RHGRI_000487 [Rhododendron griersonianum]